MGSPSVSTLNLTFKDVYFGVILGELIVRKVCHAVCDNICKSQTTWTVKEKPPINKSMGASKNLQHPIAHPSEGPHWLRILAGELAFRLQEAREETPGLWPKTLVLHVRQGDAFCKLRYRSIDHIIQRMMPHARNRHRFPSRVPQVWSLSAKRQRNSGLN